MTEDDLFLPSTERGIAAAEKAAAEGKKNKADGRVQVNVRIRPPTKADQGNNEVAVLPEGWYVVVCIKDGESKKFTFDHVFQGLQEEVYDCIGKPMLQSAFKGYNTTLFAYGQTGAGKTHSVMGYRGDEGLLPRYCRSILAYSQVCLEKEATLTIRLSMSFVELYNEQIRDLLEKKKPGQKVLTELQLREGANKKIFIENVSIHTVLSYQRIEELLEFGNSQRTVAATKMNDTSSRSHSIIILRLLQKYEPPHPSKRDLESIIHIVDLAGSERQGKTGAEGQQLTEANNINASLVTLGRVLNSFSEGGKPPLRDSKLTRILSDSFGGNSQTWMLACLSPSALNVAESLSTLAYASSAKKIVNKASVNGMAGNKDANEKIKQLQLELQERMQEITELQQRCEALEAQLQGRPVQSVHGDKFGALAPTATPAGFSAPASSFAGGSRFIGRAKLSLKNCVLGMPQYNTLPLVVQNPAHDGASLIVNTWPVSDSEGSINEYADLNTAIKALSGKRFDFCVHVISAEGIPDDFTSKIFCRYVFAKKEEKPLTTEQKNGTTEPQWDYKKRFAWSEFTPDLGQYLSSDNVLTFEVIGYPTA
eukprot:GGOE01024666.1.p1 GENE.GGOE01024666.1~~GGOE01024666.1.p1  ORF type:complete len:627 (-),score=113.62 GGOE01024666.1:557-2338(-)